ncbi:zinc finger protein 521 [Vespa crabro]|uniref:zinc finger protein 521 n=1 Tax=Vespa crabro TaxID=7445 RepID=UPI001F01F41A|nr:zinc finger protein 521 [Vespa crabro]XP_046835455.1 zinc finger protein 521 [Vespa crabro]
MSSTMAQETTISDLTELDSDGGSSSEERDLRKRLRGDADFAGPKKRRKQTTPVRFSSSLMNELQEESNEDEEDDDDEEEEEEEEEEGELDVDSEGKLSSRSPSRHHHHLHHHHHHLHHHHHPSIKDENLNNEFRCQYCGQFLDSKETLNVHLDNEHGAATNQTTNHLLQNRSSSAVIKLEGSNDHQSESPVNLLTVKNFASSWLNQQQQNVQSQTHIQSQNDEPWPGPSSQLAMSNHLQALTGFPGALGSYLPLPTFPLHADPTHIPRTSIPSAPVRIFNPEAYCDLCNKEFCNKYFLKTHKANKHGIYVDSPGPNTTNDNNSANVLPSQIFPSGGFTSTSIKLEPPATPPMPSVPCDVCQKRFKNDESMRKHKQKIHNELIEQTADQSLPASQSEDDRETPRSSPGGIETLFKQEFGIEQEDTTFMPAPRHLSPQSIQQARDSGFNADRLRRLGVINPEAFCEICCKEYCNKYFLRTHKMKRHGIIVHDNEKSPSNPAAALTWHQVQTSPLNLIVAESGNGSESNDRTNDDYECKPCGIRFQTVGLYQAHSRKIHENEEQQSPKQEFDQDTSDQRTDSISEDLQKLQTMILQLNGLESNIGKGLQSCNICGRECESRTSLRIHMATEHSHVTENPSQSPIPDKSCESGNTGIVAFCTLCEKDYVSQEALKKHIVEEHQATIPNPLSQVPPPPPPAIGSTVINTNTLINSTSSTTTIPTSGNQTQTEKKITSMTPTSSYCEICNKELCNKYFMKTHMQRMHGIEIENGAQIGGVICNICNKELCSKYFLRVHKHNTHGIVDENATTSSSAKQEAYDASSSEDSALKPEQLGDLSHRYFTHFTEVCPICSRRFRSIKWLKAHLLGDHGKIGIDKWRDMEQQYQATTRNANRSGNNNSKNVQQVSNLKIPNGYELSQQNKTTDLSSNIGNQVLSNLFGSTSDDQQMKNYRCSYCNFSTTILPFLFLHERSHVNAQESIDTDNTLQCPICSQGFHQPEQLHQHLLTRHQFPALLTQFQTPILGNPNIDQEKVSNDPKDLRSEESKDDNVNRNQINPTMSQNLVPVPEQIRNQRNQEDNAVQVTPHGAYKCAQCGYATTNLNRIKKHVRKDHTAIGDPTDSVIAELSKTLKDVANRHKLPACYAMPQDINVGDKTIMQPFLIDEQQDPSLHNTDESNSEKRFMPALVYLPVKSRISSALTASFTLTPA